MITTWNEDMGRERLLLWWPTWRLSMRVCLSCDQWRAYLLPASTWYTVWYDMGTWNASVQDEWHSDCVYGDDSLACLSEDAVPDSFGLYKAQEFGTSVLIGWSTARSPRELVLMFELWQSSDSLAYDRVLWTRIYAVGSQVAEAVRRQQRRGWFTYRALFYQKEWEIAQLHLDRRERERELCILRRISWNHCPHRRHVRFPCRKRRNSDSLLSFRTGQIARPCRLL